MVLNFSKHNIRILLLGWERDMTLKTEEFLEIQKS